MSDNTIALPKHDADLIDEPDADAPLYLVTANGELAGSVSHDPNVLVSKCLDIAREKGLALLCWPTPVMPTIPTK